MRTSVYLTTAGMDRQRQMRRYRRIYGLFARGRAQGFPWGGDGAAPGVAFGAPSVLFPGGAAAGSAPFAGQQAVASIDAAIAAAAGDELCVIGGGEVYAITLPRATHLHLTWIDTEAERADAFFPRFDPREWRETARVPHAADRRHEYSFSFVDYERA